MDERKLLADFASGANINLCGFRRLILTRMIDLFLQVSLPVDRFLFGIFRIAPGILHFSLNLLYGSIDLLLFVSGPFACLTLDATGNILNLALDLIFIHG